MAASKKVLSEYIIKPDTRIVWIRSIPVLILTFIVFVVMVFFLVLATGYERYLSVFVILVLDLSFLARIFFSYLNLRATSYVIKKDGVHFHEGFFTRREKFIPVHKITDVRLIQAWPLQTLLGVGSIVLESAGFSSRLSMESVADPHTVYEHVKDLVKKKK